MSIHPFLQESLEIKAMKLDLDLMKRVDKILGFPSKQFTSIQIAGTNGKGSVATKIAKAIQENGKKVGLYTSPHIQTYHERIQINGIPIPEERADSLLKKIVASTEMRLTYFELLTLLAFCYFSEERVDFAVLEVGMGGRLDATNIVHPVLSIITSIDFDHTHYLGNTLEAIAYEKAGIIKPGVPALIGPHARPIHIFETIAEEVKSPLFRVEGAFVHYEEENQAIARTALSLLPFPLEQTCINMGLAATPPCRFEMVLSNPIVILDVAHNPNGLQRTFERLAQTFPKEKIRVLASFSADKAIEDCLEIIRKQTVEIHLTHTNHVRLQPLGDPWPIPFETAYHRAKEHQEILLICGTFFIMHHARTAIRLRRLIKPPPNK